MTKNVRKVTIIARITQKNRPKHPQVVVEKKGFPTFLDALPKIIYLEPSSGPFQISIWVILPVENTPKHPKTPQNTPKHPKTPQNTPKHVQKPSGTIFGKIDFWRFFDLYDPFSVIFGSPGVLRGVPAGQKMTKNDQK